MKLKLLALKPEKEYNEKLTSIILYDKDSKSVELLEKRDFKNFDIDENLPEETKRIKKSKPDAAYLKHISSILNNSTNLKDVEIELIVPPGIFAVMKKLVPIPPMLQEEYFEFHESLMNFKGKLTSSVTEVATLREIKKIFLENFSEKKRKIQP